MAYVNNETGSLLKKIAFALMIATMALLASICVAPATAHADTTKVVTIGADLTSEQRQTMLDFFNITDQQLESGEVQEVQITNAEERSELSGTFTSAEIGTKTISCAYIEPTTSGGINVETANLTTVTKDMLYNAIETSGIKNCNVVVGAPYAVSGTGALTGIFKAYETTGNSLDPAKKDAAEKELAETQSLQSDDPQRNSDMAETISDVKNKVASSPDNMTDEQINDAIDTAAKDHNVTLSDQDRQAIQNIADNVQKLDYDTSAFANTLSDAKDKMNQLADSEQTKGVLGAIQGFFEKIGDFFSALIGNGSSNANSTASDASSAANGFFSNLNTDVLSLDGTGTTSNSK